MTVGERIAKRRKELNLTQEYLALKVGYKTKSSINKIELGVNDITPSKLEKIAVVLNTTPAHLMGWLDNLNTEQQSISNDANPTNTTNDNRTTANTVRIAGRDGSFVERQLTDDQIDILQRMIKQMPDFED